VRHAVNDILNSSGVTLAAGIRRRELTSEEICEAFIARIQQINPVLNAVVCDRFDEARAEARAADSRLANGDELPPFHGVPCSIKESFALTGMPNTAGLVARKGVRAREDAPTVARLRAAGAIPLGVTNISELCMWMESNNRVYGRSNNPYDPTRIVGGSSGGEGAIIAAAGTPFGLGSDVGGSIRLPAFFNGIFGHKPSGGWIDNRGQYPVAADGAMTYLTTGPLCRYAEDLAPLLRILGPERELVDPNRVDLRELEVVSVTTGATRVSDDLVAAQESCERALADRGAKVRRMEVLGLKRAIEIWSAMMEAAGGPSFSELLGNGTPIHTGWQLLLFMAGRSPHTFPAIGLALLEKVPKLLPGLSKRALEQGHLLSGRLAELLGDRTVMLYPTYSMPAPRHNKPILPPIHWGYTAIFNVMELPVTQVPLGLNDEGLPLGLQVAASHGNDHLTLAVAHELERAFGGWVPPPS
jgi:fatty acid amide hydrolase 2